MGLYLVATTGGGDPGTRHPGPAARPGERTQVSFDGGWKSLPGTDGAPHWRQGWTELKTIGDPRAALRSFAKGWSFDGRAGIAPERFLFLAVVEARNRIPDPRPDENALDLRARRALEDDPLAPRLIRPLLDLLLERFDPRIPEWDLEGEAIALYRRAGALNIPGMEDWHARYREKKIEQRGWR